MKLNIHHVGGRFGNGGFPLLRRFEKDFVRVFYDADADCVGQVREKYGGSRAEVRVFPFCIGESERRSSFHINYDPTSSSLYRFSEEYGSFYFFCHNHDFIVSETMRTMETREVDVLSLDYLFQGKPGDAAAVPDFLSMDVQGAEYDVLQGAKSVLENDVLAVSLETWFHPVYSGQKVFGDVSRFLSDRGFHFVKFLDFTEYTPFRHPVGLRGEGFQVFADALFLKKIENVEETTKDYFLRYAKLRKLAFIGIVYNQFEYALECLRRSSNVGGVNRANAAAGASLFYRFLQEVEEQVRGPAPRYPKTFLEKYTFEMSKLRFADRETLANAIKPLKVWGRGLVVKIWLRFVYPRIYKIAALYDLLLQKIWGSLAAALAPATSVERVLSRYGLKKQARCLKRKRVVQFFFSRRRS